MAYSDVDWEAGLRDRRSTTGYCVGLIENGPVVLWKSKKQPTVALSTCEAKYMAMAATTREFLYLNNYGMEWIVRVNMCQSKSWKTTKEQLLCPKIL